MNRAAECRNWLRANPGWHFTSDILDAMGKRGRGERHPYAKSLVDAAKRGTVIRKGTKRAVRYCFNREPSRALRLKTRTD